MRYEAWKEFGSYQGIYSSRAVRRMAPHPQVGVFGRAKADVLIQSPFPRSSFLTYSLARVLIQIGVPTKPKALRI